MDSLLLNNVDQKWLFNDAKNTPIMRNNLSDDVQQAWLILWAILSFKYEAPGNLIPEKSACVTISHYLCRFYQSLSYFGMTKNELAVFAESGVG